MKHISRFQYALTIIVCAVLCGTTRLQAAAEREVVVREPFAQPWNAQLIHWPVGDGPWHVRGANGQATPSQLYDREVAVETPLDGRGVYTLLDLEAGSELRFKLVPGAGPPVTPQVTVERHDDAVTLANDRLAVTLVSGGRANSADSVIPPPLAALAINGQPWPITGALDGNTTAIENWDVTLTADGPIFAEAIVRYYATGEVVYQCRVRLVARQSVVHIAEKFELGPKAGLVMTVESPYELDVVDGLYTKKAGHLVVPIETKPERNARGVIAKLPAWQSWYSPGAAPWFASWQDDTQHPVFGVFTTFPQCWTVPGSDPDNIPWHFAGPAPIVIRRNDSPQWSVHLQMEGGTRTWALMLQRRDDFAAATPNGIARAKRVYGEIPLQRAKEWITSWAADARHPNLFFDTGDVPGVVQQMKDMGQARRFENPMRNPAMLEDLTCVYLFSPTSELARRIMHGDGSTGDRGQVEGLSMKMQTIGLLPELRARVKELTAGFGICPPSINNLMWLPDHMLYRVLTADVMLGAEHVSDTDKAEIRRLLALLVYHMQSPEMLPPHQNYQWGTPNMPTGWFAVIAMIGCMLSDHPEADAWQIYAEQNLVDQVLWLTQPDGTYGESYFYQERVSRALVPASAALARKGKSGLSKHQRFLRFFHRQVSSIMPVDPRNNVRNIAPIGDATWDNHKTSLLGAAAVLQPVAPEEAGHLRWAWQEQGDPIWDLVYQNPYYYSLILADLNEEATVPALKSEYLDGAAVIMRSRYAAPTETFLHLRGGEFATSHFESDQLALHWIAKGAPLCLDWGYYYNTDTRGAHMHTRPVAASDQSWRARIVKTVFMDTGDFVHAQSRAEGSTHRRLLMVKGVQPADPEFVLIRDTLPSNGYSSFWVAASSVDMGGADATAVLTPEQSNELLAKKERSLDENLLLLNQSRLSNDRGSLPAFDVAVDATRVRYGGAFGVDLLAQWLSPVSRIEMGAYQWGMGKIGDKHPQKGEHQKLFRLHRSDAGDIVVALVSSLADGEPKAQLKPWLGDGVELTRPDGWRYLAWIAPPGRDPAIHPECTALAIAWRDGQLKSVMAVDAGTIDVQGLKLVSDPPRHVEVRIDEDQVVIHARAGAPARLTLTLPGVAADALVASEPSMKFNRDSIDLTVPAGDWQGVLKRNAD